MAERHDLVRRCAENRITTPARIAKYIRHTLGVAGTMSFSVQETVVNYTYKIATGEMSSSKWDVFETDGYAACSCLHMADIMRHLDMPVWMAAKNIYLMLDEFETCSLHSLSRDIKVTNSVLHCVTLCYTIRQNSERRACVFVCPVPCAEAHPSQRRQRLEQRPSTSRPGAQVGPWAISISRLFLHLRPPSFSGRL